MLSEATKLAARAADVDTAFDAVAQIGRRFQVEEVALQASVITAAMDSAASPVSKLKLVESGLAVIDRAIAAARFSDADRWSNA